MSTQDGYRLRRRLAWGLLVLYAVLAGVSVAAAQTPTPTPTPYPPATPAQGMSDYLSAWALTLAPYAVLAFAFLTAIRVLRLPTRLFGVLLGFFLLANASPSPVSAQTVITIDGEDWYVLLDANVTRSAGQSATVGYSYSNQVVRFVARCWQLNTDGDSRMRSVDNVSGDGWQNCRQVTSWPPPAYDDLSQSYQVGGTWAQFYNAPAVYDVENYHSSASATIRVQVLGLVPATPTPTPTATPAPTGTPTPAPVVNATRNPCITAASSSSGLAYSNYYQGPARSIVWSWVVPADRSASGVLDVEVFGSVDRWIPGVGSGLYPEGPLTYLWPLGSEVPASFGPGTVRRYVPYMLTEGGERRIWIAFTAPDGWARYAYRANVSYVGTGGCLRSPTPRPSRLAPTLAATAPIAFPTELVSFGRTPLPTLCPIYVEAFSLATPTGTPVPDYWRVCIEPERVDTLRIGTFDLLPLFNYLLAVASVSAVIVAIRSTRSS